MTPHAQTQSINPHALHAISAKALRTSGIFWFATAVIGQALFAAYVLRFYGGTTVTGDLTAWNKVLIHGIVPGDTMGNVAVALHLAMAAVITLGGPAQLVPQIRNRWPRLHRWNGRVYLAVGAAISLNGLYMVWTRGVLGGLTNHIAISLNALLILGCAAMTLRHAMARRIDQHRAWATRLFLVVSGVWFFRVGMMLWFLIFRAPVGIGKNLDGPFAVTLAYAQYVVPLIIYQLYLMAQKQPHSAPKFAMAGTLCALTLAMGAGIGMAFVGMWLPRL